MTTPRPGAGGLRGYVLACLAFILVIAAGCAFAALAGQGAPVQLSTCTLDADAGVRFVVTGVLVDGGR